MQSEWKRTCIPLPDDRVNVTDGIGPLNEQRLDKLEQLEYQEEEMEAAQALGSWAAEEVR